MNKTSSYLLIYISGLPRDVAAALYIAGLWQKLCTLQGYGRNSIDCRVIAGTLQIEGFWCGVLAGLWQELCRLQGYDVVWWSSVRCRFMAGTL